MLLHALQTIHVSTLNLIVQISFTRVGGHSATWRVVTGSARGHYGANAQRRVIVTEAEAALSSALSLEQSLWSWLWLPFAYAAKVKKSGTKGAGVTPGVYAPSTPAGTVPRPQFRFPCTVRVPASTVAARGGPDQL